MTGDLREKYLRINMDFAPLAGNLEQQIAVQKRLVQKISRSRPNDEVTALLVSVAESIEVSEALLKFTKNFMHGVTEDANALLQGAELRNTIKWQSDLIENGLR